MKRIVLACLALFGITLVARAENFVKDYVPSEEIRKAQEEFRDNKFGIFIHWGLYSMLAQGEWFMTNHDINYKEYEKLASAFYPIRFDAAKWVADIKASGARYICITSRHHEGFSMFDTEASDYNIVDATPFGRDVLKELAEECEKQGLKLHFYYSLIDWYRDDYQPLGRTGRATGRPGLGKWEDYSEFMCDQLTELLTNYGKVGAIWFDGHWDQDQNAEGFDWEYDKMYNLIHELQPGCLIGNNHHINPFPGEDIQIFERDVPGENTAGWHDSDISKLPLETCQTMNGMWGYKIKDQNYKSTRELVKYLVSTAGRNANLLLNVGPQPNGELPEVAVQRMKEMGEWLSVYGETIYGTRSEKVGPQQWGVTTHKDNRMWLHVFPDRLAAKGAISLTEDGDLRIFIPYAGAPRIRAVKSFSGEEKLPFRQYKEGFFVTLPQAVKDSQDPDFVVEVEFRK